MYVYVGMLWCNNQSIGKFIVPYAPPNKKLICPSPPVLSRQNHTPVGRDDSGFDTGFRFKRCRSVATKERCAWRRTGLWSRKVIWGGGLLLSILILVYFVRTLLAVVFGRELQPTTINTVVTGSPYKCQVLCFFFFFNWSFRFFLEFHLF